MINYLFKLQEEETPEITEEETPEGEETPIEPLEELEV